MFSLNVRMGNGKKIPTRPRAVKNSMKLPKQNIMMGSAYPGILKDKKIMNLDYDFMVYRDESPPSKKDNSRVFSKNFVQHSPQKFQST